MVVVKVKCPHCGKSLMDSKKKIDGEQSISVKLTYAGKKGMLYLSPVYGSYNIETEIEVPKGKIAGFRCPHCESDLKSTRKCDVCNAQMVAFELKDGGTVQICSRRGCKKHLIEFEDPSKELELFYKTYLKSFKR